MPSVAIKKNMFANPKIIFSFLKNLLDLYSNKKIHKERERERQKQKILYFMKIENKKKKVMTKKSLLFFC